MNTAKQKKLRRILRDMESALVTLSGGIDSTLLAKLAYEELGDRAAALTAVSPSLALAELDEAKEIAREIGIRHLLVETQEMENPEYTSNPGNRCFFCKTELFDVAIETARAEGFRYVLEGTHIEDLSGHRPGYQAAKDHGVRSPFVEAEFTKQDIRDFAQVLGISTWDKPALACLSSRFPTGTEITLERLRLIDRVEQCLKESGLRQCRARYHGDWIRIEVADEEFPRFTASEARERIDQEIRGMGFDRVLLDLIPYGGERGASVTLPINGDELETRAKGLFQQRTRGDCEIEALDGILSIRPIDAIDWNWLADSSVRSDLSHAGMSWGFRNVTIDLSQRQSDRLPATVGHEKQSA
ncbi:MAG: ATP-dependent sacrificial sulfur transferase LarE [Candidatus Omnitrophica bacterium]|nr:ATP-dependent sacrificial sulfur transferase LarE [Candidatus Omnitrophota bacterium]